MGTKRTQSYLHDAGFVVHQGPYGRACFYPRSIPERWCLIDEFEQCVVWLQCESDAVLFVTTGFLPEDKRS